jgi:hypothetical protein
MPVKVKLDSNSSSPSLEAGARAALMLALILFCIGASVLGYFYLRYRGLVADKLARGRYSPQSPKSMQLPRRFVRASNSPPPPSAQRCDALDTTRIPSWAAMSFAPIRS